MRDLDSIIPYGKVLTPPLNKFNNFTKLVYSITREEIDGDYGFVKVP